MFHRTLHTYLFRQNMFYILTCIGVGAGIYLLTDIFDRLDEFFEAGLGFSTVATYFAVKLPLIISQILPAVFLLSVVTQLCLMARHRELLALRAGGISFGRLSRFYIAYSILWCVIQLVFAQFVGVYGQQMSSRIWAEDVRGRNITQAKINNLWFKEKDFIVEIEYAVPMQHKAEGVNVYRLSKDRGALERTYSAKSVDATPGAWVLRDVRVLEPTTLQYTSEKSITLPLEHNLEDFLVVDSSTAPEKLPLWQLSSLIDNLAASGSNVEVLLTSWHSKWAYAFSILAMGLLAMALVTIWENIYLNIGISLLLTFGYYVVFMIGVTLGQNGMLPPMVGAWLANIIFCTIGGARLAWCAIPTRQTA